MTKEMDEAVQQQMDRRSELIEKLREVFDEYGAVGSIVVGLPIQGGLVTGGRIVAAPVHVEHLARESVARTLDLLMTIYSPDAAGSMIDAFINLRISEMVREAESGCAAQHLGAAMRQDAIHTPMGIVVPIGGDDDA